MDVAFRAAADGAHVAAARAFRDITGVQCQGANPPDNRVGDVAFIDVANPQSPTTASNVQWLSVTFSRDHAHVVYIDGVSDLCADTGNLEVARANGSAVRTIAPC